MKKSRKWTVIFLSLMLISVTLLAGCGGSKTDYSTLRQDVVNGRNVYVDDSGVVFFGYDNLLCTAIFEDGNVFDYVVEAGFTGDVYALAVYDKALYVSASDGIFKYDLEIFSGSGAASPEVLWDKHLSGYNHFQIYDGKMFFLYGTTLCYIPLEGGAETNLAMEAGDFDVTANGVYYSKKDGSLHLISIDGSEDKVVGEVGPAAYLTPDGGHIYYRDNYAIYDYSLDNGESVEVETGSSTSEHCYPWVKDGVILYEGIDTKIHLFKDGADTTGETMVGYPFKYDGMIYKEWIVARNAHFKELYTIDLNTGAFKKYDMATELADDLSQLSGSTDQTGTGTVSSGSYDIMEGWQVQMDGTVMYLYGNDFMMMMPNTDDWEYKQESGDSIGFYMTEPRTEGYGGHLVTIKAYDLSDDSYTSLPSYSVAGVGRNANKRFIAIFPSDVQYDAGNSAQAARYQELFAHVKKIGEGAANSPFQTADSD